MPSGTVAALAAGTLAAAIVHLVYGSPGGRPTESRITHRPGRAGRPSTTWRRRRCSAQVSCCSKAAIGTDRCIVKVYGRDAWDAQMLATLWRLAWYRGGERSAGFSRIDLVEHEGFVTLLAERAGVNVPHARDGRQRRTR